MISAPNVAERARLVVDSSAVLTLVLDPGERGESLAHLLLHADLHAPDLLPYELANVLRRRRLGGLMSATEARLAHDSAMRLPVELWPHAVVAARSWELGDVLTSYDAPYAALAERLGASLVTADARLARAPGIRCAVTTI